MFGIPIFRSPVLVIPRFQKAPKLSHICVKEEEEEKYLATLKEEEEEKFIQGVPIPKPYPSTLPLIFSFVYGSNR
jgi:hypothetical protein